MILEALRRPDMVYEYNGWQMAKYLERLGERENPTFNWGFCKEEKVFFRFSFPPSATNLSSPLRSSPPFPFLPSPQARLFFFPLKWRRRNRKSRGFSSPPRRESASLTSPSRRRRSLTRKNRKSCKRRRVTRRRPQRAVMRLTFRRRARALCRGFPRISTDIVASSSADRWANLRAKMDRTSFRNGRH